MKANTITISLVCRRKDYKRPFSHLKKKKKKKKEVRFSHWSDMKAKAITISTEEKITKSPFLILKEKKNARPVSYTEVTWNPITKSLTYRRKDYKKQKSLICRRKYYKRQKEEKSRPLSDSL